MVKDSNIVYTCPEHGKETYFKIKQLERMPKMREYVYVWFKDKNNRKRCGCGLLVAADLRVKGYSTTSHRNSTSSKVTMTSSSSRQMWREFTWGRIKEWVEARVAEGAFTIKDILSHGCVAGWPHLNLSFRYM
jgi:hypothetical protein